MDMQGNASKSFSKRKRSIHIQDGDKRRDNRGNYPCTKEAPVVGGCFQVRCTPKYRDIIKVNDRLCFDLLMLKYKNHG